MQFFDGLILLWETHFFNLLAQGRDTRETIRLKQPQRELHQPMKHTLELTIIQMHQFATEVGIIMQP